MRALVILESFTALTAVIGGALFIGRPDGALLGADPALLSGTPFSDWQLPGLLLALMGVGFAFVAVWQQLRGRGANALAAVAGIGLIAFEVVEFAMIGFHPLQAVYAVVGLAIIVIAISSSASRGSAREPRPARQR